MINKLTPLQESKLSLYRDEYLDKFFNNKKIASEEEVKEYVYWLYEFCGLKKPMVVLVDSPMAVNMAVAMFDNKEQVGGQVGNQVGGQVGNQVGGQVGNQVGSQVWNQVGNQVGNQVWNQVRNQVGNQVGSQVWNQVRNQVRNQDICWYLSAFNSWLSFYDFFDKEVLKLDKSELFNQYKKVLDLNIFWGVTLDGLCVVSRNAIDFKRNKDFQLHSVESPAITFADGYSLYFVRGLRLSTELFNKLSNKEYTLEDFAKEDNEEVKSACIAFMEEKFGNEYVYRFFSESLKEINTYVDKKEHRYLEGTIGMNVGVYTLFKGEINDTEVAFVRCYCPSTDRMFFLGVSEEHNNAKDAIASLYRIPKSLKPHIKEINRQGERYSTTLTKEGKIILDGLKKEQIEDLVSISGNEYFTKIKYEY